MEWLIDSSISLIASSFFSGSKTYIISAAAALCINESSRDPQNQCQQHYGTHNNVEMPFAIYPSIRMVS